jgi:hypothetical protein
MLPSCLTPAKYQVGSSWTLVVRVALSVACLLRPQFRFYKGPGTVCAESGAEEINEFEMSEAVCGVLELILRLLWNFSKAQARFHVR